MTRRSGGIPLAPAVFPHTSSAIINLRRSRHPLSLFLALVLLASSRPQEEVYFLAEHRLTVPVVRTSGTCAGEKWGGDEARIRVLVDLAVQVDLRKLGELLAARGAGRHERREIVVAALGRVADQTLDRLRPRLEALKRRGLVESWRGFSIVNRWLVEGSPEGIRELARWPEVAAIVEETEPEKPAWATAPDRQAVERPRRSWAIAALGAEGAWEQGLDGEGVVVGTMDSGASAVHEQLRENFRGGPTSWYDPAGGSPTPRDGALGHGTGVLSTAVAGNVAGMTLGVAPGARWIACAALPNGRYNNVLVTECADWMLTSGQPDVLINAWLLPEGGCDRSHQRLVDAWRAAEILPVFAAGNYGPGVGTDHSPANYTGLYPGAGVALAVGGMTADGAPFSRSSAGPNSCDGSIFPILVAPAEELVAALPLTSSTYILVEGTSYAAGLVAGAAAILLQRHPGASVTELETALRAGAVDLGPPGPDHRFGYGGLDLPRALAALSRSAGAGIKNAG